MLPSRYLEDEYIELLFVSYGRTFTFMVDISGVVSYKETKHYEKPWKLYPLKQFTLDEEYRIEAKCTAMSDTGTKIDFVDPYNPLYHISYKRGSTRADFYAHILGFKTNQLSANDLLILLKIKY